MAQQPIWTNYAGPVLITTIIMATSNHRTFTRCQELLFVLYCTRASLVARR